MKWSDITPDRRERIVAAAAGRLAVADRDDAGEAEAHQVTVADLTDYARGRPLRRTGMDIRQAIQRDSILRETFDLLLDRYSKVSIPLAAAASSGASRRRRDADRGVEVEWQDSSAEPNTIFVRVHAPATMRPVRELLMRSEDGDIRAIALVDEGDEIETLIDRNSPEFALLVDEGSKLWLR